MPLVATERIAPRPPPATSAEEAGVALADDGGQELAFLIHPELIDDPGLPYVELAPREVGAPATSVADHPR